MRGWGELGIGGAEVTLYQTQCLTSPPPKLLVLEAGDA